MSALRKTLQVLLTSMQPYSTNCHPSKDNYIVPQYIIQMLLSLEPARPWCRKVPCLRIPPFLCNVSPFPLAISLGSSIPSLGLFSGKNLCSSLLLSYSSDKTPALTVLYLCLWPGTPAAICGEKTVMELNDSLSIHDLQLQIGTQNCPAGLLFFSCWLTSLFLEKTILYLLFLFLRPPDSFLCPQIMTSHFTDKIEKSFPRHQTCNLHWGPFSPSWLKWEKYPSAYQKSSLFYMYPASHLLKYCSYFTPLFPLYTLPIFLSLTGSVSPINKYIYYLLYLLQTKQKSLLTPHLFPCTTPFLEFPPQILTNRVFHTSASHSHPTSAWLLLSSTQLLISTRNTHAKVSRPPGCEIQWTTFHLFLLNISVSANHPLLLFSLLTLVTLTLLLYLTSKLECSQDSVLAAFLSPWATSSSPLPYFCLSWF